MLLLAFGKLTNGPEYELCQLYLKRMPGKVSVREFEVKERNDLARKSKESRLILDTLKSDSYVILLDERGKNLTTSAFNHVLERTRVIYQKTPTFVIGGADGHTDELRSRADLILSFGALTCPHKLARVMMLEQLYRCHQINLGHPYHRS